MATRSNVETTTIENDLVPVPCENALRGLLAELAAGVYGRVVRSKGIITVRRGWVQFDLAAGEASMIAYAHTADSASALPSSAATSTASLSSRHSPHVLSPVHPSKVARSLLRRKRAIALMMDLGR